MAVPRMDAPMPAPPPLVPPPPVVPPPPAPMVTPVKLSPDNSVIWFDRQSYSTILHKVLLPGANTGNLFMVDPDSLAVSTVKGFAMADPPTAKGGSTAIAEGDGLLYVTNQTDRKLYVVDPKTESIVSSTALAGFANNARYVAATDEIWVNEPGLLQTIEIFSLRPDPRMPMHSSSIAIVGGPEGLAIDSTRQVAYASSGTTLQTYVIDLKLHTVKGTWSSGCADPKGIVLDEPNGLAFVGCSEGGATVVDVVQGKMVSQLSSTSKVDDLGFAPQLRHLYIPGVGVTVAGVSLGGMLTKLGELAAGDAPARKATADDRGNVWIPALSTGQVLRIQDTFPASK